MAKIKILSPLPGIFYRKPSPNDKEYVKEGDKVKKGTVLGLIEVMKQYNELESDVDGQLISFEVQDAQEVAIGEPIATIQVDT